MCRNILNRSITGSEQKSNPGFMPLTKITTRCQNIRDFHKIANNKEILCVYRPLEVTKSNLAAVTSNKLSHNIVKML